LRRIPVAILASNDTINPVDTSTFSGEIIGWLARSRMVEVSSACRATARFVCANTSTVYADPLIPVIRRIRRRLRLHRP